MLVEVIVLKIKILLLVALMLPTTVISATTPDQYAQMQASNQIMKEWLATAGYDGNVRDFENFGEASKCWHDYKMGKLNDEYLKLRFFLEDHPWYKGGNWQWEVPASQGYECVKYHHTGEKICRKPYFVN